MSKVNSLQVIVKFTDGEIVESDKVSRVDIIKELQKQYPRESEQNINMQLDQLLAQMIEVMSRLNDADSLTVRVKGKDRAINPKLVKYIDFNME